MTPGIALGVTPPFLVGQMVTFKPTGEVVVVKNVWRSNDGWSWMVSAETFGGNGAGAVFAGGRKRTPAMDSSNFEVIYFELPPLTKRCPHCNQPI